MPRKPPETATRTRLAVFGSRSLIDDRVKIRILEEIDRLQPVVLVTAGEPGGVCEAARQIAREHAIPLTLHFLDFKKRRGAFEHRSRAVLYDCEFCLLIHDGVSKGTINETALCVEIGREHVVETMEPAPFPASVGPPLTERDEWTK